MGKIREDEISFAAINSNITIIEESSFKKGARWADSHPSKELVEKIINLAFDGWDSIEDFSDLAQSIKEEIWNEIP